MASAGRLIPHWKLKMPQITPDQFDAVPSGQVTPDQFDPPPYQGSILPFSRDATGTSFDPLNAGITGSAWDAFKLPGDILTGKQPTPYTGGNAQADPALLQRAENLATFISPMSAASRTGAMVPGGFYSREVPTGEQLKAATDEGYAAARASGATIPEATVNAYGTGLQQHLQNTFGLNPKTAPKTFAALDDLAPQGRPANFTDLEAARRQLNAIKTSSTMGDSDPFAAKQAIPQLDTLIDAMSPAAATARANAAAGFRANAITGDLTQANTGILEKADTIAQLRQRVKTFTQNEDNMRGFSPEEQAALDAFVKSPGGAFSTGLTKIGNLLSGAGTAGAFIGSTLAGPFGASVGAAGLPAAGGLFKGWANQRASSALDAIGEMLRSHSPLGEQYLQQNVRTPGLLNRAIPPLLESQIYQPQQPQPAIAPNAPGPPRPTGEYFQPYGGSGPIPFGARPLPRGLLDNWA
jgi:hypothetical protein